jgi:hypothetical protein
MFQKLGAVRVAVLGGVRAGCRLEAMHGWGRGGFDSSKRVGDEWTVVEDVGKWNLGIHYDAAECVWSC